MKRAVILIVCVAFLGNAQTKQGTARVPFVGCAGGGQLGWVEAPTGGPVQVSVPWQAAAQLAYYKPARDEGVLAPRGWHCYYEYDSSGHSLFISPQKISNFQQGFSGPLIELTYFEGFSSGRFDVWRIMARAFPSRREFVTRNLRDWQFPPEDYRLGPRPGDLLQAKSERVVAFQRAEGLDGFGPSSFFLKGPGRIEGEVVLGTSEAPWLLRLSIRLPQTMRYLIPVILGEFEREAVATR